MNFFKELFSNDVLIVTLLASFISQVLKFFTNIIAMKTFDFKRLLSDGGMPSAHTATVVTLAVMSGFTAGFDSVIFAVAMILAIVVMRDAVGVRREAGKHAESIQDIAEALNRTFLSKDAEIRTENFKILIGHTPLQVTFGAIVGIVVSVLYIVIFKI